MVRGMKAYIGRLSGRVVEPIILPRMLLCGNLHAPAAPAWHVGCGCRALSSHRIGAGSSSCRCWKSTAWLVRA